MLSIDMLNAVTLSVIMLIVIMLSIIILSVVMLSVEAPWDQRNIHFTTVTYDRSKFSIVGSLHELLLWP
jgi:hypothetical protein